MDLETIKSQLKWAKENLSYAHALDNLEVEQVEWLIEQAEKVEGLEKEVEFHKGYCLRFSDRIKELELYKDIAESCECNN